MRHTPSLPLADATGAAPRRFFARRRAPRPVAASRLLALALPLLLAGLLAGPARPAAAGMRVMARCPCGYAQGLSLFAGRSNFRTVCMVPGLCLTSGDLVTFNLLAPDAGSRGCPDGSIVSYADPPLAPKNPGRVLTTWNVPGGKLRYVLYESGYFCPRCHRKTLRFSLAGFFD